MIGSKIRLLRRPLYDIRSNNRTGSRSDLYRPGNTAMEKQRSTILHDYHYKYVKKDDIPAYTRQMGIGLIITGAGIIITGLFNLVYSALWWIPLLTGFVIGSVAIYRTQKKYNGSVLG